MTATSKICEAGTTLNGADFHIADDPIAELPSRVFTGLVSCQLSSIIQKSSSLVAIEACVLQAPRPFPPLEAKDTPQTFHIRTFVDGDKTLVYCWMAAECNLFLLEKNDDSREPYLSKVEQLYRTQEGTTIYEFEWFPVLLGDAEVLLDCRRITESPDPKWHEFTYYKDHALPHVLLEYIYSRIEHERFPAKGQRGLTLPKHIWDLLDGWILAVEARLQSFGRASPNYSVGAAYHDYIVSKNSL